MITIKDICSFMPQYSFDSVCPDIWGKIAQFAPKIAQNYALLNKVVYPNGFFAKNIKST
jgi:hypothetical protein